jgi:hypothetical protein
LGWSVITLAFTNLSYGKNLNHPHCEIRVFMSFSITDAAVKAAMAAVASDGTTEEKIQMLIELARGLQKQPKTPSHLRNAVSLYYQAYELCSDDYPLWKARAKVGIASALQVIPTGGTDLLLQAKAGYETDLLY